MSGTAKLWWLYLLACEDGRTYAGIAVDINARFAKHLAGKGARFTRANRPIKILGAQAFPDKSQALKAEHALQRLDRPARLAWARRWPVGEDRSESGVTTHDSFSPIAQPSSAAPTQPQCHLDSTATADSDSADRCQRRSD